MLRTHLIPLVAIATLPLAASADVIAYPQSGVQWHVGTRHNITWDVPIVQTELNKINSRASQLTSSISDVATPGGPPCLNGMPMSEPGIAPWQNWTQPCSQMTLMDTADHVDLPKYYIVLAEDFNLTTGHIEVQVPNVSPSDHYIVGLFIFPNETNSESAASYSSQQFSIS
ncbi:hypothetical protein C8Q70DRAFT_157940 [Cubamyces menziesii]|nr:hypothetical protein C8Q70DRAFT_157940 [Cubamyces menziesii]